VRLVAILVFVVGVVVALAAALAGPSRPAVATRRTVRGGLDRARQRDFGPVGRWVGRNRGAVRIGIVVAAFLVLVGWSEATGWTVLGLGLIVAVLFGLVEIVSPRAPPSDGAETESQAPPADPADPAVPPPTADTNRDRSTDATPVGRARRE
jgi:hypothetical protein